MRDLRRIQAVEVTGAGLRPYFAQVNRDLGNIEFVELFGGRNGVIFYGADGYSTTQVNTGEIFYKGGTTYFIVGTSSLLSRALSDEFAQCNSRRKHNC